MVALAAAIPPAISFRPNIRVPDPYTSEWQSHGMLEPDKHTIVGPDDDSKSRF